MQFSRAAVVAGALGILAATGAIQIVAAETSRIVVAQADRPSGAGTINSVDVAGRKVNMTHGPVAALKWPGMTMDFPVAAEVDMKTLKPGAKVGFTLKQASGGVYEIDSVKPAQ